MTPTHAVRPATPADADAIAEFNRRLARETEGLDLDPAVVAAGVAAALADPAKGTYLVAEGGDGVVGQLMLTAEWSDWRNAWVWWVQSVYVRADARGGGVVRALFAEARRLARGRGVALIRLYVEEHNAAARAAYARLGLAPAGYLVYEGRTDE